MRIFLIRRKRISNAKMNKWAEIESPWRAPLFSLKYFVVVPPLMTHDSWFFKMISIHEIKFWPNPNLFKTEIKNLWSNESKAFSRSIFTKKSSIYWVLAISIISDTNLPLSPMFLLWTYAVCCADIRHGKIFLRVLWIIFSYQHLTKK